MKQSTAIAIHGGAGVLTPDAFGVAERDEVHRALREALSAGDVILRAGGTSLDAVEAAVIALEECPWFNAGKGAVFTDEGEHELDAAIMDGARRDAGAVAGIRHLRNPVRGARAVMERSEHLMLIGGGADRFLAGHDLPQVENAWFDTELRRRQWREQRQGGERVSLEPGAPGYKFGTVGAVALDAAGHVAAATSTGGITNKRFGRVGDSPLIGAGTWADDRAVAVSATGHGEYFIRAAVAHEIAARIRHGGASLEAACRDVVQGELKELGGSGGVIAVAPEGELRLEFNTPGMYRAWRGRDGSLHTAIFADEDRRHP
ncbi:isoaspartyl peptidase/L-asparaginase family protein [Halomonas elongata]|uniref:isoaspartyl peptidase/L-asparaginase family protein n=1 Tax=Halomonas elongata TaxID=2746 RepID=UPI0038D50E3C